MIDNGATISHGVFEPLSLKVQLLQTYSPLFEGGRHAEQVDEILARLWQLEFLFRLTTEGENRVHELEIQFGWTPHTKSGTALQNAMSETECFAEAFYMFAFRVVDLVRYINASVFGEKTLLPEPLGIINVRNWLIIHPEKQRGGPVLSRSLRFAIAEGRGVILKPVRQGGESAEPVDAGFRVNAQELRTFLEAWSNEVQRLLLERERRAPPAVP